MACEYIPVDSEHPFNEKDLNTEYYKIERIGGKTQYVKIGTFSEKKVGPYTSGRTITWNFVDSGKKTI